MNIAIAINEKYIPYAYVMLVSLMENHRNISDTITVYILFGSIPDEKLEVFAQLEEAYGCSIVALQVPLDRLPKDLPHTEQWSVEVYFRLMLQDLMPEDVDRILYLDTDIVISGNIEEYYRTSFGENNEKVLVVNADMSAKRVGLTDSQNSLFESHIKNGDFTYFNAGVMLMNLDALRREFTLEKFLDEFAKRKDKIFAQEQDLLNDLFYGRTVYVDETRYDLFAKIAYNEGMGYEWVKKNTSIIHYAGRKPWSGEGLRYDTELIWWEYAAMTPFYTELMRALIEEEARLAYADTTIRRITREKSELGELVNRLKELVTNLTGEKL
ncbi:MAG: glycosyltransferase family 8 protein [Lachnospiraceae bacterium]|nr:glycosyltransferase family 8 protein [Lachnospiraceae bacterium]